MRSKTIDIDLNQCNLLIIEDEIEINGIGYCCIIKCPTSLVNKLTEYAVSVLIAKGAKTIILGFRNSLHKPIHVPNYLGNLHVKHIYNMLDMKKKLSPIVKIKYDKDIKFKKVNMATIQQYMKLYNEVFKDVSNAATYNDNEIIKLIHKKNYELYFAYHKQIIIGFCEYQLIKSEAVIEAIGIKESYRRNGYAKTMLNNLYYIFQAENVKIISLTASTSNKNAIALYKQEDFIVNDILSYWYKIIF